MSKALSDLADTASTHIIENDLPMGNTNAAYADGKSALYRLTSELERLRVWHEKTVPIVATLAIYGDKASLYSLAEKARALNEAKP